MHRALVAILAFNAPIATALCVVVTIIAGSLPVSDPLRPASVEEKVRLLASASNVTLSDPSQLRTEDESVLGEEDSALGNTIVYQPNRSHGTEFSSAADPKDPVEVDRAYLAESAIPGGTMMRQGPELAIGRLHPEFVRRLTGAIREARQSGLSNAGIFSAYRPPAFGVGGFSDKFNSLHTYGLAVDMSGIGGPGSAEAKLWYEIAAKHGVVCPYGFANHIEWNHCQPTRMKIILAQNPLRETVTADGPINLESMFEAGNSYIESPEEVADSISSGVIEPGASAHVSTTVSQSNQQATVSENGKGASSMRIIKIGHFTRLGRAGLLREPPTWCKHKHHPPTETCDSSHQIEATIRAQGVHRRQASTNTPRHHT
jgi:hypothetical protein